MGAKTVNKLAVPGATLHYEVTGSGPMLLLIAGAGPTRRCIDGSSGSSRPSTRWSPTTRRGNSRSRYDGEPVDERIEQSPPRTRWR